jgi:uridine phosphorylase
VPVNEYPILEFDPTSPAIIEPSQVVAPLDVPEHCVVCFFYDVVATLVAGGRATLVTNLQSEMGAHPIYQVDLSGRQLIVVHPGVGAALAATMLPPIRRLWRGRRAGARHGRRSGHRPDGSRAR